MEKYNNLVALHEVIIKEDNSLVFDIDSKKDLDVSKL